MSLGHIARHSRSQTPQNKTYPQFITFQSYVKHDRGEKKNLTDRQNEGLHPQHYLNYFTKRYVKGKVAFGGRSGQLMPCQPEDTEDEGRPVLASHGATFPPSGPSHRSPVVPRASSGSPGYHTRRIRRAWRARTRFAPARCAGCSCFCLTAG